METNTPPVKKRIYKPRKYVPKPPTRASDRQTLQNLILKKNYSIAQAADFLDINETLAHTTLFLKHPSQEQINYAFEIYNKGLPLLHACVASGVSIAAFKVAYQKTKANPYRNERR